MHKHFHVFCQFFGLLLPSGAHSLPGPHWYHYSSPGWAGPWERHGDAMILGGSGGVRCHSIAGIWVAFFSRCQRYRCAQAAIAPDGTPTMFGPGTMTPANRSDPHLLVWNQSFSKSFNQGPHGWSPEANSGIYMPLNERKSTNCNTLAVSGPKQSKSVKNCVRSGRGLGHKRVQGTVECQPAGVSISDLLRQLHDGARPAACKRL